GAPVPDWSEHRPTTEARARDRRLRAPLGGQNSSESRPAVLLAFDVLRLRGEDLTATPLCARSVRLESLLGSGSNRVQLIAQTADAGEAQDWLNLLPNIEGWWPSAATGTTSLVNDNGSRSSGSAPPTASSSDWRRT